MDGVRLEGLLEAATVPERPQEPLLIFRPGTTKVQFRGTADCACMVVVFRDFQFDESSLAIPGHVDHPAGCRTSVPHNPQENSMNTRFLAMLVTFTPDFEMMPGTKGSRRD